MSLHLSVFSYQRGEVNEDCLSWNETMANWTAIKDVSGLMDYLKPKVVLPPVPAKAFQPPNLAAAAAAAVVNRSAFASSPNASTPAASSPAASSPAAATSPFSSGSPAAAASPLSSSPSATSPLSPISAVAKADPLQPKVTKAIPAPPAGGEKANWVELKTPEGLFYYYNKVRF